MFFSHISSSLHTAVDPVLFLHTFFFLSFANAPGAPPSHLETLGAGRRPLQVSMSRTSRGGLI